MAHAQGDTRGNRAGVFIVAGLVSLFVCMAFAAAASWVVAALYFSGSFGEPDSFGVKMLIKAIGFTAVALGAAWLVQSKRLARVTTSDDPPSAPSARSVLGFLPAVLLASLLFFPNLDQHPWPAPDELHHLIVARNLAEHGAYASGLAPNVIWFDHYDSVGAPVIGLVAGAFKEWGAHITPARAVVATFGVVFVMLTYFLFLPLYGTRAARFASLFTIVSFGSIYLSRSLYGEVPAFAFVLMGLLAWRRGLNTERAWGMLAVAGMCFGLAVLTKAFMAVALLAVVGVYLYDRATFRRISIPGILLPAAGTLVTLGAWSLYEYSQRHLIGDQPSLALYYRHSLTFGLEPIWQSADTILLAIPAALLGVCALGFLVPRVFRAQYDPALAVLLLLAPLLVFWFVFFTPLHLPRYLWYPAVIAAMGCGPLLDRVLSEGIAARSPLNIPARAILAAIVMWVYLVPSADMVYKALTSNQAGPDMAVARALAVLPPETRIATTYWPAERLVNFLLERPVTVLTAEDLAAANYDVLIHSDRAGELQVTGVNGDRYGHYVVYTHEARLASLGAQP